MRSCLPLFCLALPLFAACNTTQAKVPHVDRATAIDLVIEDLDALEADLSDHQWRRAYRHFDQHVEPHLAADQRLALEVRFGALRSAIGEKTPDNDKIEDLRGSIVADLQPQD